MTLRLGGRIVAFLQNRSEGLRFDTDHEEPEALKTPKNMIVLFLGEFTTVLG